MKIKSIFFVVVVSIVVASCGSIKEIPYFQNLESGESIDISQNQLVRTQPNDQLSILVNSKDPLLADLFNLPVAQRKVGNNSNLSNYSQYISCYTIDEKGEIDFPVIGKINIAGKTRGEVADYIKDELVKRNLIQDPTVTVEFVNHYISILGEVKTPGRYMLSRDNTTILDAIGMAGDLTIYGLRNSIKVLSLEGNQQKVYTVNLCDGEALAKSPVYFIQQNDVIYVEPNKYRSRQSTVNANNVRSTSFWISLASLATSIMSTIVVVLSYSNK